MRTDARLDSWTAHHWTDGVQIDELCELESVSVQTRNSTYEIVVTSPSSGDVLVRGGARFPAFTRARLGGCSVGGSLLKRVGVYPGFRVEFEIGGRRILTSPVVSVQLAPPAPPQ